MKHPCTTVRTYISDTIQHSDKYKAYDLQILDVQHNDHSTNIDIELEVSSKDSSSLRTRFSYSPWIAHSKEYSLDILLDKAFEEVRFTEELELMLDPVNS